MLFTSIFVIYFKRSATHPSLFVRVVSYCLFVLALVAWAATFVWDMWHFFKTGSREISSYFSYNIFLLVSSVAGIFLIGVMQALTTEKEQDWMEKRRMREE
jgi:predicted membrane-bound mannosyltransferase